MAFPSQGLLVGALVLALAGLCGQATAQVPIPTPAPQPKERSGAPAAPAQARQAPPQAQQPQPGFNPLSGLKSLFNLDKAADSFDTKQRGQVDRVSQYLSSVHQLSGSFVQVGPDG